MRSDRNWAWVVPWFGGGILAAFERPLLAGLGQSYSCLFYFVAGLALGWAWYRLHPRHLASRIFGLIVLLTLGIVAATAFTGGRGEFVLVSDPSPNNLLIVGVLAGLVLAEGSRPGSAWRRQRQTALTSRETLRGLR